MQNFLSRRSFIRSTAIGIAGAAVLPGAASIPTILKKTNKKVGIALVGLGYYSTDVLAPALQETEVAYLAGIVTGSPEKEKIWSAKYGIPRNNIYNYENFDEIISNSEIEIIYVVLPNSMHKEFTIRAAKAGKHVICEKPMALNASECREMIDACKKYNVLLSIGYRLHYEPHNIEAMRFGQEQVFGQLNHISCGSAFRNSSKKHWKLEKAYGGGAMMDMGVYPLQAARYVTGEEPVSVSAQAYSRRPQYNEVEEAINFQLEFPGGTIANLSSGFHARFDYLYASADKGWFELKPYSGYGGIKGESTKGKMDFPAINQQANQMDDVANSILNQSAVKVPGEEGLKDMIVVDAIYKALKTNRKIILS